MIIKKSMKWSKPNSLICIILSGNLEKKSLIYNSVCLQLVNANIETTNELNCRNSKTSCEQL